MYSTLFSTSFSRRFASLAAPGYGRHHLFDFGGCGEVRKLLFPWHLENAIRGYNKYYNEERDHESLGNVTPDAMYFGRALGCPRTSDDVHPTAGVAEIVKMIAAKARKDNKLKPI